MGLQNNALLCIGPSNPTNITGATSVQGNQVWSLRTNTSATFTWAYSSPDTDGNGTSPTVYTALGVKHAQLQTPQNVLFLADSKGINVLAYWYLTPRETPVPEFPPRTIPYPAQGPASVLSHLDGYGGVYAAVGARVYWMPVVRPLSADPPGENGTLAGVMGGPVQALWMMQNSQTLYVAEWFNSSNNVWRYDLPTNSRNLSSPLTATPLIKLNSTTYPNPPSTSPVVSSVVAHPTTGDIYLGLFGAGGVLIYDSAGVLRGQITTTFRDVLTLDLDNDGLKLYIGGGDGQGSGRVDLLVLGDVGLGDKGVRALSSSDGGTKAGGTVMGAAGTLVVLTLGILYFM
ncbi:hypothetical protein DFS34DRAFT_483813 [Phlyctochytrium arcticum]|nr:hypothetical protein DFS34DRAFT_483813 [Phlyctochytrium arcticum]